QQHGASEGGTQVRPVGISGVSISGSVRADLRSERESTQQRGDTVQLPTSNQPVETSSGSAAERKFVMCGNAGLACRAQRGWTPVSVQIIAVHDHLRLVLCLSNRKGRVHVEILCPRIVAAELQSLAQPANQFQ